MEVAPQRGAGLALAGVSREVTVGQSADERERGHRADHEKQRVQRAVDRA